MHVSFQWYYVVEQVLQGKDNAKKNNASSGRSNCDYTLT